MATAPVAITTRSCSRNPGTSRTAARRRRLIRFLTTAFPEERLITNPTAPPDDTGGALTTVMPPLRRLVPVSNTRRKSRGVRRVGIRVMGQAANRLRPLSRRALRTARPALVCIRCRNPRRRLRRRTLG